jgi:GT2 family glycosyltransferase
MEIPVYKQMLEDLEYAIKTMESGRIELAKSMIILHRNSLENQMKEAMLEQEYRNPKPSRRRNLIWGND